MAAKKIPGIDYENNRISKLASYRLVQLEGERGGRESDDTIHAWGNGGLSVGPHCCIATPQADRQPLEKVGGGVRWG